MIGSKKGEVGNITSKGGTGHAHGEFVPPTQSMRKRLGPCDCPALKEKGRH